MWLVKYNENGRDQKQYFEDKQNLENFTSKLKERNIKFKVSKDNDWKPGEGESKIDNPDRIVNDKQKSVDKFVESYKTVDAPKGARFVQAQNPVSKKWNKIDKKTGKIISSSKKKFKSIPIVGYSEAEEGKKEKMERKLHEFQIELTPSTRSKSMVNYNGDEVSMGELPKNVHDAVSFIMRKLRPEERKKFYADDTATWDIVSKVDGTLVVKDDEGKDYTKILKQRINKAKL